MSKSATLVACAAFKQNSVVKSRFILTILAIYLHPIFLQVIREFSTEISDGLTFN